MSRLATIIAAISLLAPSGLGQTTTGRNQGQTTVGLADATPQENVAGGRVSARAPGTWVRAAIARHVGLMNQRLNGPRFGQPNTAEAQLRFGQQASGSSSGLTGLGGLADLLNLATQFAGTGSLGDLGSFLGSLGGTTGGTGSAAPGGASGTQTGGSLIPPPSNGTSYTLEDLIALGQALGGGSQKTINAQSLTTGTQAGSGGSTQTQQGRAFGGAIGRLPKPEQRFQTATTTTAQPGFKARWLNAMLETFFSALTLGLQSDQFIEFLKDGLRPLLFPSADGAGGDSGGDDTSDGGGGNGAGNGTGVGIEDLPPADGTGQGGGSTI